MSTNLCDCFFLFLFGLLALPQASLTLECHKDLGAVGLFFLGYWAFFIVRNSCLCCYIHCSYTDPNVLHSAGKACFMAIDLCALGYGAIWGTMVL